MGGSQRSKLQFGYSKVIIMQKQIKNRKIPLRIKMLITYYVMNQKYQQNIFHTCEHLFNSQKC